MVRQATETNDGQAGGQDTDGFVASESERMKAPYKALTGRSSCHGGYQARSMRYPCAAIRPHRNAAGMTYTASRGGGDMSDEVRALAIWGTLDTLRCSMARKVTTTREKCSCCRMDRDVRRISPIGRRRLLQLYLNAAARKGG